MGKRYHIPASLWRNRQLVPPQPEGVELSPAELTLMEKHHGPHESWPVPGEEGGKSGGKGGKRRAAPPPSKTEGGKSGSGGGK